MSRLKLQSFYLLVSAFFGFLIPTSAEEVILPPIEVEFLIIGLKHSESLLKSGTGRFKIYGSSYFGEKKEVSDEKTDENPKVGRNGSSKKHSVIDLQFAFSNEHSYLKYLEPIGGELIFDGRIQLTIPRPGGQISVNSKYNIPSFNDPRDWGIRYEQQKLSDFLLKQHEQGKIRITGSEILNGIPCYIVEASDPLLQDAILKFWIAAEDGFYCVRILRQTETEEIRREIKWQKYQLKDGTFVWFPRKGIMIFLTKDKKNFRNEMEMIDFQPNVDVSSFFNIQVSPGSKVWNADLRQWTTFKEIGWRKIEE